MSDSEKSYFTYIIDVEDEEIVFTCGPFKNLKEHNNTLATAINDNEDDFKRYIDEDRYLIVDHDTVDEDIKPIIEKYFSNY